MAKIEKLCLEIIDAVGGQSNIKNSANCMTRLRITVKDPSVINDEEIERIDGVLGLVHDKNDYYEIVVGPGTSRKCADYINENFNIESKETVDENNKLKLDWKENKKQIKSKQKQSPVKAFLKIFGEIFVPLIPGVMTAGLCAGIAALVTQICPDYKEYTIIYMIYQFLILIKISFMTYISAWAGYRACERFGGTPILGGMMGMITGLPELKDLSELVGSSALEFLSPYIHAGCGGVIASLIGAWCISKVEKFIRKHMYANIDIIATPLLTMFIIVVPYVFVIMPFAGACSEGIAWVVQLATTNDNIVVRIITGYVSAALFLPLVAMGMHHSLIAIYTVQLNSIGYVTLYPALCMGGFGQIGAAIAIYIVAIKVKNTRLIKVINGSVIAGILGVGEPLIYGVTLPLGKPFFTAGLGAGFGGAIVMAMQCASTSWGPSGLLGTFVVTAGPNEPFMSILFYLIGGAVSILMGFLISRIFISSKDVAEFN